MKGIIYRYKDFYGCTYVIRPNAGGSYDMIGRIPQGDVFHCKNYSSFRGARIAMWKISDGTARPTNREEI